MPVIEECFNELHPLSSFRWPLGPDQAPATAREGNTTVEDGLRGTTGAEMHEGRTRFARNRGGVIVVLLLACAATPFLCNGLVTLQQRIFYPHHLAFERVRERAGIVLTQVEMAESFQHIGSEGGFAPSRRFVGPARQANPDSVRLPAGYTLIQRYEHPYPEPADGGWQRVARWEGPDLDGAGRCYVDLEVPSDNGRAFSAVPSQHRRYAERVGEGELTSVRLAVICM